MKPIPKTKRLLLQKTPERKKRLLLQKSIREQVKKLSELIHASVVGGGTTTGMRKGTGGASFPGPEPGKGTDDSNSPGEVVANDTRSSRASPKTTGREDRKWRRKL